MKLGQKQTVKGVPYLREISHADAKFSLLSINKFSNIT